MELGSSDTRARSSWHSNNLHALNTTAQRPVSLLSSASSSSIYSDTEPRPLSQTRHPPADGGFRLSASLSGSANESAQLHTELGPPLPPRRARTVPTKTPPPNVTAASALHCERSAPSPVDSVYDDEGLTAPEEAIRTSLPDRNSYRAQDPEIFSHLDSDPAVPSSARPNRVLSDYWATGESHPSPRRLRRTSSAWQIDEDSTPPELPPKSPARALSLVQKHRQTRSEGVAFVGPRINSFSLRPGDTPRKMNTPAPLRLGERPLSEAYTKTPFPHGGDAAAGNRTSVFEEDDPVESKMRNRLSHIGSVTGSISRIFHDKGKSTGETGTMHSSSAPASNHRHSAGLASVDEDQVDEGHVADDDKRASRTSRRISRLSSLLRPESQREQPEGDRSGSNSTLDSEVAKPEPPKASLLPKMKELLSRLRQGFNSRTDWAEIKRQRRREHLKNKIHIAGPRGVMA